MKCVHRVDNRLNHLPSDGIASHWRSVYHIVHLLCCDVFNCFGSSWLKRRFKANSKKILESENLENFESRFLKSRIIFETVQRRFV